ncbi:MAG: MFS transporter [Holosporales bacterium]|jgi:MFS family permease|nr:MFS transporter [Holosporales bacterium]
MINEVHPPDNDTPPRTQPGDGQPDVRPRDGKLPATVWQIGTIMCLMNVSFVMAYSFSGLYLKHILGATAISIGLLEGLCETASHVMKLFSGMLSDFMRRRKAIMIVGYILSVLSKPILAASVTSGWVCIARMMERFGNGIQASPRDAIIADVVPRKRIGASYGLKRSLAYMGSLFGGVLAIIAVKATNNNYQAVFALASIPAIVAFGILVFMIKEPKRFDHQAITSGAPLPQPKLKSKFSIRNFQYLGMSFWLLMGVNTIFMMARMNETFLILRMNEGYQADPVFAPIVMIVLNIGTAISSYPIGLLGDKFNRVNLLSIGIAALLLADIIMYSAHSATTMCMGILCWGIQLGSTQNVFVSLIAEKVPEDLRGTGIGTYWLINAFSAFCADVLAGFVAHHYSLGCIFISSGITGLLALLALYFMIHITMVAAARGKVV